MWCTSCQQDVPGLGSVSTGKYSCPRCGVDLCAGQTAAATQMGGDEAVPQFMPIPDEEGTAPAGPEPPTYDGWELEQQLRHIERLLRIDKPDRAARGTAPSQHRARRDASHGEPLGWHYPEAVRAKAARRRAAAGSAGPWLPALTWFVLAVGLMASAFGGVLLAWGAASGRQDLWAVGMPVGLAGQIILVIGLILQLDRLWHDNRHTAEKLDHVDERLYDLNKTTTLLGTGHSSISSSFYAHMASGASPQLLLADLKSQLDLLAIKLGQEDW
jgi:hypothetical protein